MSKVIDRNMCLEDDGDHIIIYLNDERIALVDKVTLELLVFRDKYDYTASRYGYNMTHNFKFHNGEPIDE